MHGLSTKLPKKRNTQTLTNMKSPTQKKVRTVDQIKAWISKNEYCSKCNSPKEYCQAWGKDPSAIDTKDLLVFINTK